MVLDYLSISKYNINRFIVTCIINSVDEVHQLLVLLLRYFNYIILISYNLSLTYVFFLFQLYYENYIIDKTSTSNSVIIIF